MREHLQQTVDRIEYALVVRSHVDVRLHMRKPRQRCPRCEHIVVLPTPVNITHERISRVKVVLQEQSLPSTEQSLHSAPSDMDASCPCVHARKSGAEPTYPDHSLAAVLAVSGPGMKAS